MRLTSLDVVNFRGYARAEVRFDPGVATLLGRNGQGKTNLVEAVGYVATLGSHRVATDTPLIRHGTDTAIVRTGVHRDGRDSLVELEIVAGRPNRARLNRSMLTRPRDVLGTLRTVLFAPEDLALVKGEPSERRSFLDDLLVARQPRWSGVRHDYDKTLKQRNAVLKSMRIGRGNGGRRGGDPAADDTTMATLSVFDSHLAQIGAALSYARLRLLHDLRPYLDEAYAQISASDRDMSAAATYRSSLHDDMASQIARGAVPEQGELLEAILATMQQRATAERERGVSLVGPHRDDLQFFLGETPAKGYASHGESWSIALALRLASFQLLRHDLGTDPVLILDDVFAELDVGRRTRLADMVGDCEQVIVTAAVAQDVPDELVAGAIFDVVDQSVTARSAATS
ncbi:MAG: DNA replication/repair protein RecF [Ornithinimicrobium sp.]